MKDLRNLYFSLAKKRNIRVAIGSGEDNDLQDKIISVLKIAREKKIENVMVVGRNLRKIKKELPQFEVLESEDPEELLIELLQSGEIQGAVRGNLSARKTIEAIKRNYKIDRLLRLGPIDVSRDRTFILGPLGIDEGIDFNEKVRLIKCMIRITQKLGLEPRIALMSLGRNEDVGRDETVDKSIQDVGKLLEYAEKNGFGDMVSDAEILLENLDRLKSNCILAPTGYIGNIMYRCLVHLGCGRSYGGYICGLPDTFIDTSRSGSVEEYLTAIAMAKSRV